MSFIWHVSSSCACHMIMNRGVYPIWNKVVYITCLIESYSPCQSQTPYMSQVYSTSNPAHVCEVYGIVTAAKSSQINVLFLCGSPPKTACLCEGGNAPRSYFEGNYSILSMRVLVWPSMTVEIRGYYQQTQSEQPKYINLSTNGFKNDTVLGSRVSHQSYWWYSPQQFKTVLNYLCIIDNVY